MSGLFNDDTLSLYLKLKEAMKQYVRDAMPGGVLNREIKPQDTLDAAALSLSPVPLVGDAAGLLADGYRYATDPSSRTPLNYGLSALGALPFVPSMAGQIAWHGSPHKFDKFDLSKIGTGEGAQAYGHGLYLAESPKVAKEYQKNLSQFSRIDGRPLVGNKTISSGARTFLLAENADLPKAIQNARDAIARKPDNELLPPILKELESLNPDSITKSSTGQLYKTDIPDEAVARFLDWDKPLSEQAKEVQAVLKSMTDDVTNGGFDLSRSPRNVARAFDDSSVDEAFKVLQQKYGVTNSGGQYFDKNGNPITDNSVQRHINKIAGKGYDNAGQLYSDLMHIVGSQSDISATLKNNGIPGIRYLDGGSRGAGTGTSNFVVFDPEMIRILERNGEATGAKPWQPGEWEGLFKK